MNPRAIGHGVGGLMLVGIGLLAAIAMRDRATAGRMADLEAALMSYPVESRVIIPLTPGADEFGTVALVGLSPPVLTALARADLGPDEWRDRFSVFTGGGVPGDDAPSVIGRYEIDDAVRFRPRFPLTEGMRYSVRVRLGTFRLDTVFAVPPSSVTPTTTVTAVYPSAGVLPMNQLRMYIHFSAPMRIGEAFEHIRLYDDDTGEAVADPFVVIEDELWDPERQRLTMLFDPGRIKRGLRPHEEAGLPLQAGRRYRLHVDAAWRDAGGVRLADGFEKRFRVVDADRESPRTEEWELQPPRAGTTEALSLSFPEPLDHALLHSMLAVRGADGQRLAGRVTVTAEQRSWRFVPHRPWAAGRFVVVVDTDLEDLAGNDLRRLFDVNLQTDAEGPLGDVQFVELPFHAR